MKFREKTGFHTKSIIKKALQFYITEQEKESSPGSFDANIDWEVRRAKEALEVVDEVVSTQLMKKLGGQWLGATRTWMQCKFLNGETVTWGSNDYLKERGSLTVSDIEDLAALIAASAINEDRM